jgi:AcrR family transcriptional regulator
MASIGFPYIINRTLNYPMTRTVTKSHERKTWPLGRRPGNHSTRDTMLDAAEEVFARSGYAAASLREIAAKARVNQALVRHYFASKDGLFKAIFLRRGRELARERLELLDLLEKRAAAPTLEEIVRAYLIPAYNMKRRSAGGVAFIKLQARLAFEPSPGNLELRTLVHEETMQRFIAAFRRAAPHLDAKALYWRTVFMVGAFQYAVSEAHRVEVLSDGLCDVHDADQTLAHLVPFLVGGFERAG